MSPTDARRPDTPSEHVRLEADLTLPPFDARWAPKPTADAAASTEEEDVIAPPKKEGAAGPVSST